MLAEVIVDGINRLAPREDENIPEHIVEAMHSALRHGRYNQAAELGHQGFESSVEGPDGCLFSTICLAAIRLAEPVAARSKCLRVLGTLALSRPRPEITTREIFKYRWFR